MSQLVGRLRNKNRATVAQERASLLDQLESISKIVAALAVPIVIAVVGWRVQTTVADEGIKKDYVTMALAILRDDKATDPELRAWALEIVEKNSPVPLSGKLRTKIVMGAMTNYGITFVEPPDYVMKEPAKVRDIPMKKLRNGELTLDQILTEWVEAVHAAKLNELQVRSTQKWVESARNLENDIKKIQGERVIEEMDAERRSAR